MRTSQGRFDQEYSYEERRARIFARQNARKIKERRRRMMLIASLAITLFIIGTFAIKGKAVNEGEQKFKYYTSVSVGYGDSLWSLADQYMDRDHYDHFSYIAEIKSINHISDANDIKEGSTLILPYYSNEFISD